MMQDEAGKSHSILGIVSCIVGCLTFFIFLSAIGLYYLQFRDIAARPPGEGLGLLQMLAAMLLPIPVHIGCLVLGATSLFFPNRKKIFPILSVALNLIFAVISLFPWLWLMMGGMGRV